jgi:signal-transduction protein with cAMP-binding, CBS, and nucleotidyltransferase domain
MRKFFCGFCDRIKDDDGWIVSKKPRDPQFEWKSTHCRVCLMELASSKNRELAHRLTLRLIDIMKPLPTIRSSLTADKAAEKMCQQKRGILGATSNGVLVGIITDRDFTQKVVSKKMDPSEFPISKLMSYPIITVSKKVTIPDAAVLMSRKNVRHLVIKHEEEVWKVVSARSLAESLHTVIAEIYKLEHEDENKDG